MTPTGSNSRNSKDNVAHRHRDKQGRFTTASNGSNANEEIQEVNQERRITLPRRNQNAISISSGLPVGQDGEASDSIRRNLDHLPSLKNITNQQVSSIRVQTHNRLKAEAAITRLEAHIIDDTAPKTTDFKVRINVSQRNQPFLDNAIKEA